MLTPPIGSQVKIRTQNITCMVVPDLLLLWSTLVMFYRVAEQVIPRNILFKSWNYKSVPSFFAVFPQLGISVKPVLGSALFWFNIGPNMHYDSRSVHFLLSRISFNFILILSRKSSIKTAKVRFWKSLAQIWIKLR